MNGRTQKVISVNCVGIRTGWQISFAQKIQYTKLSMTSGLKSKDQATKEKRHKPYNPKVICMSETNINIDRLVIRKDSEILDWLEVGSNLMKVNAKQVWVAGITIREAATKIMKEEGV